MQRAGIKGLKIATGTYTGDGTLSQAITGIGFKPIYLSIWQHQIISSPISLYATIPEIMDNNVSGMNCRHMASGAHSVQPNEIISLDIDGFTVDDNNSDSPPNKNTDIYEFLCIG